MPRRPCPMHCPCVLVCRLRDPMPDSIRWSALGWMRKAWAYYLNRDPKWLLIGRGRRTDCKGMGYTGCGLCDACQPRGNVNAPPPLPPGAPPPPRPSR